MNKLVKSAVGGNKGSGAVTIESVADILEREIYTLIGEWLIDLDNSRNVLATGGNEHSKGYSGTEDAALNDGLASFSAEPCHQHHQQDAVRQGVGAA